MVDAVAQALRELFGPLGGVETFGGEPEARIYRVGGHTFQVESCPEGDVLHVHEGLERLRTRRRAQEISLIAAPFMGEVPRDLCEREGAGWLDLCGNARVVAPGLYIHVDGRPNRFRRPGGQRIFSRPGGRTSRESSSRIRASILRSACSPSGRRRAEPDRETAELLRKSFLNFQDVRADTEQLCQQRPRGRMERVRSPSGGGA